MFSRLLFLEPGQLRRASPFFALYLVLFAALTLADGLSLSLFVTRVGAASLPSYQAIAALCVMLSVGWYLRTARRHDGRHVFLAILGAASILFTAVWIGLNWTAIEAHVLGLLFIGRELAYALVLLHFGAYLQDFFTREELSRVMPAIYAGGRLGGIAAGCLLERLSPLIEPAQLLGLLPLLLGLASVGLVFMPRRVSPVEAPHDRDVECESEVARDSGVTAFAARIWQTPLLFWITLTTAALFLCRAGLSLQSGLCFQNEFTNEAELTQFLGRYAQIALAVSLPLQLLIVGRLVAWIGLSGAQMLYALLIAGAALGGWGEMSLATAVFARFVETELRYAVRNPLAQMTVNLFPKQTRTSARAWSLGILIPATTFVASLTFGLLVRWDVMALLSGVTILAAAAYVAFSLGLADSIRHVREVGAGARPVALPRAVRVWCKSLRIPSRSGNNRFPTA